MYASTCNLCIKVAVIDIFPLLYLCRYYYPAVRHFKKVMADNEAARKKQEQAAKLKRIEEVCALVILKADILHQLRL